MQTVRVVFRKFPDGSVIALFPDWLADYSGNISSYQHLGQHGAASPQISAWTSPATPAEYAPLLAELGRIGYENIQIGSRITGRNRK